MVIAVWVYPPIFHTGTQVTYISLTYFPYGWGILSQKKKKNYIIIWPQFMIYDTSIIKTWSLCLQQIWAISLECSLHDMAKMADIQYILSLPQNVLIPGHEIWMNIHGQPLKSWKSLPGLTCPKYFSRGTRSYFVLRRYTHMYMYPIWHIHMATPTQISIWLPGTYRYLPFLSISVKSSILRTCRLGSNIVSYGHTAQ